MSASESERAYTDALTSNHLRQLRVRKLSLDEWNDEKCRQLELRKMNWFWHLVFVGFYLFAPTVKLSTDTASLIIEDPT